MNLPDEPCERCGHFFQAHVRFDGGKFAPSACLFDDCGCPGFMPKAIDVALEMGRALAALSRCAGSVHGVSVTDPQPPPANRDDEPDIADLVMADLAEKKRMGIAKYGVALRARNGRSGLIDLYQELLDAAQYVRQVIREQETTNEPLRTLIVWPRSSNGTEGRRKVMIHNVTRHVMQALIQLREANVITFEDAQ